MLLALVLSVTCGSDPDLKWVDAIAQRSYSEQPNKKLVELDVKRATLQLRSAKAAPIIRNQNTTITSGPLETNLFKNFPSKEAKKSAIDRGEKEVSLAEERLKSAGQFDPTNIPWLPKEQPKLKHAGTVWNDRFRVIQVVDPHSAIVEILYGTSYGLERFTIWLEADTSKWSDGALVEFHQPVIFVGNHQYETTSGGTKTLLVARTWTEAELKRFRNWRPGGALAADSLLKPDATDTRRTWLNTSYDSTVRHVRDKTWEEVDNKTGKVKWPLTEKDRTTEYIELQLAERDHTYRLLPTKLELLKDGKWEWLSNGKWDSTK